MHTFGWAGEWVRRASVRECARCCMAYTVWWWIEWCYKGESFRLNEVDAAISRTTSTKFLSLTKRPVICIRLYSCQESTHQANRTHTHRHTRPLAFARPHIDKGFVYVMLHRNGQFLMWLPQKYIAKTLYGTQARYPFNRTTHDNGDCDDGNDDVVFWKTSSIEKYLTLHL